MKVSLAAWAALAILAVGSPVIGRAEPAAKLSGTVVDKASGLPLPGAKVTVLQTGASVTTDASGRFAFSLLSGRYVLEVGLTGYQTTDSTPIDLPVAGFSGATLAIQRVEASNGQMRTIASTTTRASESLKSASINYSNLATSSLLNQGYFGLQDALQNLPDVDNATGLRVANKGAGQYLSIRGIGQFETVALIDGHQAVNFQGTYDFSNTPLFGLQSTQVIYGSGTSGLYSVDAIGGVIDLQTLEPTIRPSLFFSQSYGTYNELSSIFQATGTLPKGLLNFKGRFGYAVAFGVDGEAGQYRNSTVYSPFVAFDASAPAGSLSHDIGYTHLGTDYLSRGSLVKLRYNINDNSRLTADVLTSDTATDQSGAYPIYQTYQYALAHGNQNLQFKLPSDPCPAGTFTATNFLGYPNGFDQNGNPDGGITCQTPQQYAKFNTGYELFGPLTQAERDTDTNLRLDSSTERNTVVADVYTNTYNFADSGSGIPWAASATALQENITGAETGGLITEDHLWRNNEVGVGFAYRNSVQNFLASGSFAINQFSKGREYSYFFRDVWHPVGSPLTTYFYDWQKRSSLTETSYNDPRVALVYQRPNDVIRAAFGLVATQPSLSDATSPFAPTTLASFGASLSCGVPNSIGELSVLVPERASDEELSYAHRWHGDSLVQVSLYNEIVRQKFFFTTETLSAVGTAGIPTNLLDQFENAYTAKCGPTANVLDYLSLLGVFNIGRVQAQGIDIQGRQRFTKTISLDYGYDVQSTKLLDATPTFLQSNLAIVPGAQLPNVPLQTASLGLNYETPGGFNAHVIGHYFASNNSRNAPAYWVYNANMGVPIGNGTLNFAVQNLFNLDGTSILDLCGGVPLALNQYATAVDYQPCIGPASPSAFAGAGGRRLIVTYSRHLP